MTYCVAIKVNSGLVFASDSRTNAGVDYVRTVSKMFRFVFAGDRVLTIMTSGNLATSQAVINTLQRDLENRRKKVNLQKCEHLFDIAEYIGKISREQQEQHEEAVKKNGGSVAASFILGGQIKGQEHEVYLIYPEGNYISTSSDTPFMQIGETKYGKPILDRVIADETSLDDAARCALVSIDSTMRSNISVGPPVELALYTANSLTEPRHMTLKLSSPLYKSIQESWNNGLRQAFDQLPRFDWEI